MSNPSLALNAAIRTIQGESDMDVVRLALGDVRLATVIALAPDAHLVARDIAALCGILPALLDTRIVDDSELHAAIVRLLGTREAENALWVLAHYVVTARWETMLADALINAVQNQRCDPHIAAALIGPGDEPSRMLRTPSDIAVAIRRWGRAVPNHPTAWMHALSTRERSRLITTIQRDPSAVARCLPWLPQEQANQTPFNDETLAAALSAFAEASPTAMSRHANIVHRLVAQARPGHLDALTRLACAMGAEEVWNRVHALVQEHPFGSSHIVTAAPWSDLPEKVRDAILACADASDVCAAIALAQGRIITDRMPYESAAAFFAALDPKVWNDLTSDAQRPWRQALWEDHAHLAVRSPGRQPEFLAVAQAHDDLIAAARRHAPADAALRRALLPVALRDLPPNATYALITALPTPPPDLDALFHIAARRWDRGSSAVAWGAPRMLNDLACAVVLQRSTDHGETMRDRCEALQNALRGRSWNDLKPIVPILDATAYTTIMPDGDAIVDHMAHPERREEMRQALERLAHLPPEVVIPTHIALTQAPPWSMSEAAEAIAHALHNDGDVFLAIVDALADDLRNTFLPLPEQSALSEALRDVAHDDPPTAHLLAHALRRQDRCAIIHALLLFHPSHTVAIWRALPDMARRTIISETSAAHDVSSLIIGDPVAPLALAAIQSCDDDLWEAGIAALARNTDVLRTIWNVLPQDTQQSLRMHPSIAVCVADIVVENSSSPVRCSHFR